MIEDFNKNLSLTLAITNAILNSTEEGILALDQNEKIFTYNDKFIALFDINEEFIKTKSSKDVIQKIARHFKEAKTFLTHVLNLCQIKKKAESFHQFELTNGKIYELHSRCFFIESLKNIQGIVLSFRDVSHNRRLEKELIHMATHDPITSLPNRLILMDRLQQGINYVKRNNLILGVLMVNIDNFKYINETFGHLAGDELLKTIAYRLKNCTRGSDTVTRYNSDEFIIVTPALSANNIQTIAQNIKKAFNEDFFIAKKVIEITASIGVSIFPLDTQTGEDLLKKADCALYHAKELGGNCIEYYSDNLNESNNRKIALEMTIQHGIDHNEFEIYYQPLFNLKTNKIFGAEALVRWNHPTLGVLLPDAFIPMAERTGKIVPLGNWVLKIACNQIKKWQDKLKCNLSIAVNISSKQIQQKNFVESVKKILKQSKLSPSCLELEVTENTILDNSEQISNTIKQLKDMGIKLVMDDFGIGYSSLNYIKIFPFDKIKIDKSFTQGISTNIDDKNIVQAIIHMTKSMNLEVIAEGVETAEQLKFLQDNHSDNIQGYYISPPIESDKFVDFVKHQRT